MGISGSRAGSRSRTSSPTQGLPRNETVTPVNPAVPTTGGFSTAPPPPFVFADRPPTAQAYQTPPRIPGSGSGASPAFASQQPQGFNPVQSFLSGLPDVGSTTPWVNNMALPPEAMNPFPDQGGPIMGGAAEQQRSPLANALAMAIKSGNFFN